MGDHLAGAADGDLIVAVRDVGDAGQPVELLERLRGGSDAVVRQA